MSTTLLEERNGHDPSLADQVVLSGAGLISSTVERSRQNTSVVDGLVLGSLDLIDDLNAALASFAPKPSAFARKAYTSASDAVRQVLASA
jgi:hypothetical protein